MKVAIIGAGRQGNRLAKAVKDSNDEIVAVVDVDASRAAALADIYGSDAYSDWRTAVKDRNIDAIVICTYNDTHAEISIEALKAGKHVLCEKPIARNVEEAIRVLEASKRSKAKLKCGFNHRCHPAMMQAKKIVDSGELGKLIFMRCRYGTTGRVGYEKDWRMNPEISGGGQLIDQGQHALDLFRWFGGDISEVMGYTDTLFWNVPVEDNAFALLRAKAGHICSVHMSWTEWKNLFSFEIFGKKAYLKMDGLGGSYGTERLTQGKMDLAAPFSEKVIEFEGPDISFREEWRELTSAIKENREPIGNAEDGLAALKLTFAIYESSKEGKSVKIL
jgi:predicted dehydrogenase